MLFLDFIRFLYSARNDYSSIKILAKNMSNSAISSTWVHNSQSTTHNEYPQAPKQCCGDYPYRLPTNTNQQHSHEPWTCQECSNTFTRMNTSNQCSKTNDGECIWFKDELSCLSCQDENNLITTSEDSTVCTIGATAIARRHFLGFDNSQRVLNIFSKASQKKYSYPWIYSF